MAMFTAQVDLPTPPFPAPTETMFLDAFHLLLVGDAAGARDLGVPLDLRFWRPGKRGQRRVDVVVNLVLEGAGRGGQDHGQPDRLRVDHRDILDHLELQHAAVELRILHRAERLDDRFFGDLRDGHTRIPL